MQTSVLVEIDAPGPTVFAYVADLTNNPEWQSGVTSAEWGTGGPPELGASCRQTMDDGSVVVYRVVALEPGKSITVEPESGSTLATAVTRTVQVLNDSRCRVRMDLVGRIRGWRLFLRPLVIRVIRTSIEADYRRLKRLLEGDQSPLVG